MPEDRPTYCSGNRSTCNCPACNEYHAHRRRAHRAKLKGIPTPPPRNEPRTPYVPARWGDYAECRGANIELFFTETRGRYSSTERAKKICRGCQAKDDCLTYAIERSERFGIWGGLTTKQRQRLGNRSVTIEDKLLKAEQIRQREATPNDKSNPRIKRSWGPVV